MKTTVFCTDGETINFMLKTSGRIGFNLQGPEHIVANLLLENISDFDQSKDDNICALSK